jgi:hypothetical protein
LIHQGSAVDTELRTDTLDEETSGERRSSKDTVSELDFNEPGGVEQTPVPRGVIDLAATQDTLECLTLDVEIRERAVTVDVVHPAPGQFGLAREIDALVQGRHASMLAVAG